MENPKFIDDNYDENNESTIPTETIHQQDETIRSIENTAATVSSGTITPKGGCTTNNISTSAECPTNKTIEIGIDNEIDYIEGDDIEIFEVGINLKNTTIHDDKITVKNNNDKNRETSLSTELEDDSSENRDESQNSESSTKKIQNVYENRQDSDHEDEVGRERNIKDDKVIPVFQSKDSNNLPPNKIPNKTDLAISDAIEPSLPNANLKKPTGSSRYGWGCITPKFLQFMNKPVVFLMLLSIAGAAQGLVVTGVSFTILTSIEKQFGFSSSHVGLFGTVYDGGFGVLCVIVGFLGHRNKPRWIGGGMIAMALGAALLSVPKYIIGGYQAGIERDTDFCQYPTGSKYMPECGGASPWYFTMIFLGGNLIMGIGATPLYVLGPAHIDEITTRGQNGLYNGVFAMSAALGPAIGFIIGLPILNTWVDIEEPVNFTLSPEDRNWVGAWWMGYLIGAVILFLPALPILGFPRFFPNTEKVKKQKRDFEDDIIHEDTTKLKKHNSLSTVWPATKSLIKNVPFICICLSAACEGLTIGGFSTFFAKLVETQFNFSSAKSGLYTGAIIVPGAAGGMLVGGLLLYRFKWNCKQMLKVATILEFIALLTVCCMLIGCGGREVVGGNVPYQNQNMSSIDLNADCNKFCQCSTRYYKPVCSVADQQTYYSPCHAGCSNENSYYLDEVKYFRNCSCLEDEITGQSSLVKDGRCTPVCNLFPYFFIGAFLMMFFTFVNNVPILVSVFRVVPEGQGSFAMGFQQIFVRFLGFIPAPTMFGKLIDESCKLWHRDECTDETSSCLEYENENFRYYIFILGLATKLISFLFLLAAYKIYKLPQQNVENVKTSIGGSTSNKVQNMPQV